MSSWEGTRQRRAEAQPLSTFCRRSSPDLPWNLEHALDTLAVDVGWKAVKLGLGESVRDQNAHPPIAEVERVGRFPQLVRRVPAHGQEALPRAPSGDQEPPDRIGPVVTEVEVVVPAPVERPRVRVPVDDKAATGAGQHRCQLCEDDPRLRPNLGAAELEKELRSFSVSSTSRPSGVILTWRPCWFWRFLSAGSLCTFCSSFFSNLRIIVISDRRESSEPLRLPGEVTSGSLECMRLTLFFGVFFSKPTGSLKYPAIISRVGWSMPMIHMTMKNAIIAVTKSA
jgi:hypothetical protein